MLIFIICLIILDDLNIWLHSYQNRLRKLQLQKQRKVGRFNRYIDLEGNFNP